MHRRQYNHRKKIVLRSHTEETTMNTYTGTWILLFWLSFSNCETINYKLIKDYLQWNNIKVTIFLTCERTKWTKDKNIIENFKNNDILTSHWNTSQTSNSSTFNYDHFLLRSAYPFCVVLDWNCGETLHILKEISKRKMFHYERCWLMFGTDSNEMFSVLRHESINIDAEVAIIVPISKK